MYRRWISWLLIVIVIWLIISRFTEISQLAKILSHGKWGWVLAAALLQLTFYAIYSGLYQAAFAIVLVRSHAKELLPVVFSSVFVNVAVPTGGASGLALFVDDANRRGQSGARAAAGLLLVLTLDFSIFTVLLGLGMAHLAVTGELQTYQISAAGVLLGIIVGLGISLVLGLWRPWLLLGILRWVQHMLDKIAGWFKRGPLLSEDWAARNAMDFSAASLAITKRPLLLAKAIAIAAIAQIINVTSLYVLFLAFYGPVGLGVLLSGYAIGNLFWIVSITPQGVGVVEGVMALALTSLKVPIAAATVIVLAYRGLAFWMPLFVGFITLRRTRSFR